MTRRRHRRTREAWDQLTARFEDAAARVLELEQQLTGERATRQACDALMGDLVTRREEAEQRAAAAEQRAADAEQQLAIERERGRQTRELLVSLRQRLAGPRPTLPNEKTQELPVPRAVRLGSPPVQPVVRLGSPEWLSAMVGDLPGWAS